MAERDAIPDEGPVLPDGRADLQRFQAEYRHRVTALKEQVDAARKRRNAKWPFGRSKAS